MSLPALRAPSPGGVVLYSLPNYEPTHEPGTAGPPRRWSSLRPVRGPQLTLVAPPDEQATPPPNLMWRSVSHLMEVLDGRRPVDQLRTFLADSVYEALLTRLRTKVPGRHHRLRRLHTCYPTTEAVELTAVLEIVDRAGPGGRQRRVRAAAIRLERANDRWRCVVLRVL